MNDAFEFMNAYPSSFPVISALVFRHLEDAAFYWAQLDWTLGSPLVGLERLRHFHRLPAAHLDGIETAGSAGWDVAYASLERWRKPGEAFSCLTVAARHRHGAQLDQVSKLIYRHPGQLVRGAMSVPVRINVRGRIRDQLDAIDRMEEWMNKRVAA